MAKIQQRSDFANKVEELETMALSVTDNLASTVKEITGYVEKAILGKQVDMDPVSAVLSKREFYSDILYEVQVRLKAAKLALWQYDLQFAKDGIEKAIQAFNDARMELQQITLDKTNFVRASAATGRNKEVTDRIANYDVLIVDARSRSGMAKRDVDKAKSSLEELQTDYNEVAKEEGWPLEPEKVQFQY